MSGTFYCVNPLWTRPNRFYRVHASPKTILGIWLGGQYFDKTSVRAQLFPLYLTIVGIPVVEMLARWAQNRKLRLERQYEATIADHTAMVSKDARNFLIARDSIAAIMVRRKRMAFTNWLNHGDLTIVQTTGARLRLIVWLGQDMDGIVSELGAMGYPLDDSAT